MKNILFHRERTKILLVELYFEFSTRFLLWFLYRKINNWTLEPPTGIKKHRLMFNVLSFSKDKQINSTKLMTISFDLISSNLLNFFCFEISNSPARSHG